MAVVLLVDDDASARTVLGRIVTRLGHEVIAADGSVRAATVLAARKIDLTLTDMEMPDGSGFDVLEAGIRAKVPVIIVTGHGSVEMAVGAMRKGAANFLAKPFTPDSVASVIEDVLGRGAATATGESTPTFVPASTNADLKRVLATLERVADTDATVLLTGESGTGKEVIARAIHATSKRRGRAFAAVNCGAIPEALLESELFGHARGAFTGATTGRRGRFQVAEGGTLFLDEIGDMSPVLQVKLLRVLQERTYEVLGESTPVTADVRFIAATHRNLTKMVADGTFREDLFYRLNVIPLHLPPLRERVGDIPSLARKFVADANAAHGRNVSGISDTAMTILESHSWPGNVRELSNVVERAVVLKGAGVLEADDVPPLDERQVRSDMALPLAGLDLADTLARLERSLIEQAMERVRGNKTLAANLLRINRTTLVEKLKRSEGGGR